MSKQVYAQKSRVPDNMTRGEFASIVSCYLDDVNLNDIYTRGGNIHYDNNDNIVKMKYGDVSSVYDKMKSDNIKTLKNSLKKKLIVPAAGIVSLMTNQYGKLERTFNKYNFDEFLNKVGPSIVRDINEKVEDTTYTNEITIMLILNENNGCDQINIAPLGSNI